MSEAVNELQKLEQIGEKVKDHARSLYETLIDAESFFSQIIFDVVSLMEESNNSKTRRFLAELEHELWDFGIKLRMLIAITRELEERTEALLNWLKQ